MKILYKDNVYETTSIITINSMLKDGGKVIEANKEEQPKAEPKRKRKSVLDEDFEVEVEEKRPTRGRKRKMEW